LLIAYRKVLVDLRGNHDDFQGQGTVES